MYKVISIPVGNHELAVGLSNSFAGVKSKERAAQFPNYGIIAELGTIGGISFQIKEQVDTIIGRLYLLAGYLDVDRAQSRVLMYVHPMQQHLFSELVNVDVVAVADALMLDIVDIRIVKRDLYGVDRATTAWHECSVMGRYRIV